MSTGELFESKTFMLAVLREPPYLNSGPIFDEPQPMEADGSRGTVALLGVTDAVGGVHQAQEGPWNVICKHL